MNDLREAQERLNKSLINLMCITVNKKAMEQHLEKYIKSNQITEELIALKEESKLLETDLEKQLCKERIQLLKEESKNI